MVSAHASARSALTRGAPGRYKQHGRREALFPPPGCATSTAYFLALQPPLAAQPLSLALDSVLVPLQLACEPFSSVLAPLQLACVPLAAASVVSADLLEAQPVARAPRDRVPTIAARALTFIVLIPFELR